jgi:hypothetical protein
MDLIIFAATGKRVDRIAGRRRGFIRTSVEQLAACCVVAQQGVTDVVVGRERRAEFSPAFAPTESPAVGL